MPSKLIQEMKRVKKVVQCGFSSSSGFPQVIIYDGKTCEVKKRIARFNDVVCLTQSRHALKRVHLQ